jgi:hypothetical protein
MKLHVTVTAHVIEIAADASIVTATATAAFFKHVHTITEIAHVFAYDVLFDF